jgi:hypothetical protein
MTDEANNMYYKGAVITDILRLGAMNADLTSDMSDPRNAIYRVPLSGADLTGKAGCTNEEMALTMADRSFHAVCRLHADDLNFDQDTAYEQCIVDARRMMLDSNYFRLFSAPL